MDGIDHKRLKTVRIIQSSVPDPNPHPPDPDSPDPHVFELPGSGSTSQKYGLLGLLGEEFSIGPLGPLRECR
jgi:hypothetical protein